MDQNEQITEAHRRAMFWQDKYNREVEGLNNEGDPIGGDPPCGLRHLAERFKALRWQIEPLYADAFGPDDSPVADKIALAFEELGHRAQHIATQAKEIAELRRRCADYQADKEATGKLYRELVAKKDSEISALNLRVRDLVDQLGEQPDTVVETDEVFNGQKVWQFNPSRQTEIVHRLLNLKWKDCEGGEHRVFEYEGAIHAMLADMRANCSTYGLSAAPEDYQKLLGDALGRVTAGLEREAALRKLLDDMEGARNAADAARDRALRLASEWATKHDDIEAKYNAVKGIKSEEEKTDLEEYQDNLKYDLEEAESHLNQAIEALKAAQSREV